MDPFRLTVGVDIEAVSGADRDLVLNVAELVVPGEGSWRLESRSVVAWQRNAVPLSHLVALEILLVVLEWGGH